MRVLLVGPPGSGKTTIAKQLSQTRPDVRVIHLDNYITADWEASSDAMCEAIAAVEDADDGNGYLVEGVRGPHALRKYFARHTGGRPFDAVVWLTRASSKLQPAQVTLGKQSKAILLSQLATMQVRGIKFLQLPEREVSKLVCQT